MRNFKYFNYIFEISKRNDLICTGEQLIPIFQDRKFRNCPKIKELRKRNECRQKLQK